MRLIFKVFVLAMLIVTSCGAISGGLYAFVICWIPDGSSGTNTSNNQDMSAATFFIGSFFGTLLGLVLGLFDGIVLGAMTGYFLFKKKDTLLFVKRIKITVPFANLLVLSVLAVTSNEFNDMVSPPVIAIGTIVSSIALWKFAGWIAHAYQQDAPLKPSASNEPS